MAAPFSLVIFFAPFFPQIILLRFVIFVGRISLGLRATYLHLSLGWGLNWGNFVKEEPIKILVVTENASLREELRRMLDVELSKIARAYCEGFIRESSGSSSVIAGVGAAQDDSLIKLLRDMKHEITEIDSVKRALGKCSSEHPQLAFVDIESGDSSAVDFVRSVCNKDSELFIGVIVSSIDLEHELLVELLKAGASDYLERPFSVSAFNTVLSRFVRVFIQKQRRLLRPGLLESAELDLKLETSSQVIAPAVETILQMLRGFFGRRDLLRMGLGLHEVIRNSYEHGNLGVGYDEKMNLCEREMLEESLKNREKLAKEQKKYIRISVVVDESYFKCSVQDDGDGFDWRAFLSQEPSEDFLTKLNGRGLLLIRNIFDDMTFSDKGNIVTLTKRHS